MKTIFTIFLVMWSFTAQSQIFKDIYKELIKYSTVYVAGNVGNAYETQRPNYFIRTDPDNLYAIPTVIDNTIYHPFDYRYGVGIRKLARFDYEIKDKHYYDGTENNTGLSAPTSAVKGLEYLIHYEKERERGEEFINSRFFIRHTGKHHIVKIEQRSQGNVDFKYLSAEVRARLPIGKKLSVSAGIIYRTHEKAYGYNPIEIWLNEEDENGNAVNPWYTLGHQYGYTDHYTSYSMDGGDTIYDWIWMDEEGNIVAYGDRDFRDRGMPALMNRYNNEIWDALPSYGELAPIVGADFYHYKDNFWLHAYGNYLLPYHHYVSGNKDFTYLNRNNWGIGGLAEDSEPEQWSDYQVGVLLGWKMSKKIGVFIEGEYTKFWDSDIFSSSVGLNLTLR